MPVEGVTLTNRTDEIGILCLAGPHACEVLARVTEEDVTNEAFGWLSARPLTLAGIPVQALRLSYTGELAYELHAPKAQLAPLWGHLWQADADFGIAPFGTKALERMRLETFCRGAHELANDTMRARTPSRNIALLALEHEETDPLMGEAVYLAINRWVRSPRRPMATVWAMPWPSRS